MSEENYYVGQDVTYVV